MITLVIDSTLASPSAITVVTAASVANSVSSSAPGTSIKWAVLVVTPFSIVISTIPMYCA
jgi:hypothetical protein